jgi:hypothetical protein
MDFQHTMHNNSTPKICSKGHCKIILSTGSPYKQCDECRERERQLQKASRARKKAAAAHSIIYVGQKHPRDAPAEQSPDERPGRRTRFNDVEDVEDVYESDEDEKMVSVICYKKFIN